MNNPILLEDFYKICHKNMYPKNMSKLYSIWVPRSNKYFEKNTEVIWFGLQAFIKKYLIENFNDNFFNRDLNKVLEEYKTYIGNTFQANPETEHFEKLHKLGYLPIEIKALEEGTKVPYKIPCMTIENTHEEFAWLTNFLESIISCSLWSPTTCATLAYEYRKIIESYIKKTSDNFKWRSVGCGDFSYRGMSSNESALSASAGFLTSFTKTSTIPVLPYLNKYYKADVTKEILGNWSASVEHSCTTSNFAIDGNEEEFFVKMCTEIYPSGNFSFVCDSYDYFNFINRILPKYKEIILSRNGCINIRPDSGDPEKVICGDSSSLDELERIGTIESLWNTFGGSVNSKGFRVLDSHIKIVYGDSITLERCESICKRLMVMGYSVENVIFGVGSYSMQYLTRDTQGWALKATYAVVDGKEIEIYKDPKTDSDSIKKSLRGKVVVIKNDDGQLNVIDRLCNNEYIEHSKENMLQTVFKNGKILRETSLKEIRSKIYSGGF